MERFVISEYQCNISFRKHVTLDITKPIPGQLNRHKLYARNSGTSRDNVEGLKDIIEQNSSLRVYFGWAFESPRQYKQIMNECLEAVCPQCNTFLGSMISDGRGDWLGFVPFTGFDRLVYEDLGIRGMIIFNDELIKFQTDVITFISQHKLFKQFSLMRNNDYRFRYYKSIRNNPTKLIEAFHYYIDSSAETLGIPDMRRQSLEEGIGCHYLRYPEIFFELLEFYKLKGIVYE